MTYPPECPAFEVLHTGHAFRKGAIVEGLGASDDVPYHIDLSIPHGTRALSRAGKSRVAAVSPEFLAEKLAAYGFWWGSCHCAELRPLTPAAVAMLAIVKAGAK